MTLPEVMILFPALMMALGLGGMFMLMRSLRGVRHDLSGYGMPLAEPEMNGHGMCMGSFTSIGQLSDGRRPAQTRDSAGARRPTWSDGLSAHEVLRERYARGEIDLETFEQMLERIGLDRDSGETRLRY